MLQYVVYDLRIINPETGARVEAPPDEGESIKLVYPCPFCEHEGADVFTLPLDEYERAACPDCSRTHLITANILPLDVDDTLYNRIAYQLRSLRDIEVFRQNQPDQMQYLSNAPEQIVFSIVITAFAFAGIAGLSIAFPEAIRTDIRFAAAFSLLIVAVSLGLTTAMATSVGALYKAYLHIEAYGLDVSVREFVLYAANSRGMENPYLIRQDIV